MSDKTKKHVMIASMLLLAAVVAMRLAQGGAGTPANSAAKAASTSGAEANALAAPPTSVPDAPAASTTIACDWPIDDVRDPFFHPPARRAPEPAAPAVDTARAANSAPQAVDLAEEVAKAARAALHLRAVLRGPATRALINNQVCGVGDTIGEFRVAAIDVAGVTVESQGQQVRLDIPALAAARPRP
ncbi:MAG: hypothetical protein NTW19_21435 [Planctomycetota bacterium]|nr:hypothetical protein [Planctomycetota bacterium]